MTSIAQDPPLTTDPAPGTGTGAWIGGGGVVLGGLARWEAGVSHTGVFHILTTDSAALVGAHEHQPSLSSLHTSCHTGVLARSL